MWQATGVAASRLPRGGPSLLLKLHLLSLSISEREQAGSSDPRFKVFVTTDATPCYHDRPR